MPRSTRSQRIHLLASFGLVILLLFTGSAPAQIAQPKPAAEQTSQVNLYTAGLVAYQKNYCGLCHTSSQAGTNGVFGPPHNAMGVIAQARILDANYRGTATTAAEYIRESITDPLIYLVPGYVMTPHRMPIYSHLSDEELDAIVAFLMQP